MNAILFFVPNAQDRYIGTKNVFNSNRIFIGLWFYKINLKNLILLVEVVCSRNSDWRNQMALEFFLNPLWVLQEFFNNSATLCPSDKISQIWRQMSLGTFLWYEKSILGWFGQLGRTCEKKSLGPIMSNFWAQFFHVFMGKKNI